MKVQKAIYGKVALHRTYCPSCRTWALVIDGIRQCCDRRMGVPETETKKRMIESNNKKQYRRSAAKLKKQVLEEQGFRCIYCGCNLFPLSLKKPVFDHFVPWAFTANTSKENLIASCQECNSIKTDRCFKDLKEAREYILPRKKG